jgi:hypothetical protein
MPNGGRPATGRNKPNLLFRMKRTLLSAAAMLLLATASFAHFLAAAFGWTNTTQDLGRIRQGKPISISYTFTNTGTTPLVVTSAKGSCGCTGVEYPQAAVMPGAKGEIKATFNAAALGAFNKSVFVESNASEGVATLMFKGEVVADEKATVSGR